MCNQNENEVLLEYPLPQTLCLRRNHSIGKHKKPTQLENKNPASKQNKWYQTYTGNLLVQHCIRNIKNKVN